MTNEEIIYRLHQLHQDMKSLAIEMNERDFPWDMHAHELLGAAEMVMEWAEEIEKEKE